MLVYFSCTELTHLLTYSLRTFRFFNFRKGIVGMGKMDYMTEERWGTYLLVKYASMLLMHRGPRASVKETLTAVASIVGKRSMRL